MKTLSITNQKGGCGKTTTAINLSSALASLGKKVLLIDLDPQAHASFGLGVTNPVADKAIYNVLTDNPEKRRTIQDCIANVSQNLDIVPSNILLSTLEQELKDKEDAVSRLHQVIYANNLTYDYVIVDCPPSLGFLTFNALRAAELVMVPLDMCAFSLMGVGKLLGMLELIKVKIHHAPQVKALATLFDRRTKYSQTMLDEIKNFFRDQMFETVIRMSVALRKAVAAGVPVISFEKNSNGAIDYMALASEIKQEEGAQEFEAAMAKTEAAPTAAPTTTDDRRPLPDESQSAREATFAVSAPAAKEVHIVGDFNHWKINEESRLLRAQDGRWEKRISLPSGTYRYKFVVDGNWVLDEVNDSRSENPFGSFDSIMKVE